MALVAYASQAVKDKAERLLEQKRVTVHGAYRAIVKGDTEDHYVASFPGVTRCDCRGWRADRACSHQIAAMIAWEEARDAE